MPRGLADGVGLAIRAETARQAMATMERFLFFVTPFLVAPLPRPDRTACRRGR